MTVVVQTIGQSAGDQFGDIGRTGEHDATHSGVRSQRRAHGFTAAGQQLHRIARHTCGMEQVNGLSGDQRRLLGGLGQHHVAGSQGRSDLADENRQREIPRADTHYRSQRAMTVVGEVALDGLRVITQEVHGFAHFGDCVGQRLACFSNDQSEQGLHLPFQRLSRTAQARRALGHRRRLPDGCGVRGGTQSGLHVGLVGFGYSAHGVAQIGRVAHGLPAQGIFGQGFGARIDGRGRSPPRRRGTGQQGRRQRSQTLFVGQVQTRRIGPVLARGFIQIAGQRNLVVRRA